MSGSVWEVVSKNKSDNCFLLVGGFILEHREKRKRVERLQPRETTAGFSLHFGVISQLLQIFLMLIAYVCTECKNSYQRYLMSLWWDVSGIVWLHEHSPSAMDLEAMLCWWLGKQRAVGRWSTLTAKTPDRGSSEILGGRKGGGRLVDQEICVPFLVCKITGEMVETSLQ